MRIWTAYAPWWRPLNRAVSNYQQAACCTPKQPSASVISLPPVCPHIRHCDWALTTQALCTSQHTQPQRTCHRHAPHKRPRTMARPALPASLRPAPPITQIAFSCSLAQAVLQVTYLLRQLQARAATERHEPGASREPRHHALQGEELPASREAACTLFCWFKH